MQYNAGCRTSRCVLQVRPSVDREDCRRVWKLQPCSCPGGWPGRPGSCRHWQGCGMGLATLCMAAALIKGLAFGDIRVSECLAYDLAGAVKILVAF